MNCSDISEMTVDFLYGELDQSSRREFDVHLAGCEACRREIESYGGALSQARALLSSTVEAPPPTVEAHKVRMTDMVANRRGWPLRTVGAPVIPEDAGGFWTWLRKPWLVPALAAAGVITLFLIAREAITPPDRVALPVEAPALPARDEPAAPAPAPAPAAAVEQARAEPPAAEQPTADQPAEQAPREVKQESIARAIAPRRPRKAASSETVSLGALGKGNVAAPSTASAPAPVASAPQRAKAREVYDDELSGGISAGGVAADDGVESEVRGPAASAAVRLRRAPSATGGKRTLAESPAPPAVLGVSSLAELTAASRGRAGIDGAKPGAPPAPPRALIELGARLYAEGRLVDAAVVYQNLLERYPAHPQATVWKERLARAGGAAAAASAATAAPASPPAAAPAARPAAASPAPAAKALEQ